MYRSRKTRPCVGSLKFRVLIKEREWKETSFGEGYSKPKHTQTYETFADIRPYRGKAIFDGTNWVNTVTHRIYIRVPSFQVTTNHVVEYDNRLFQVMNTEILEEINRFLKIEVQEIGKNTENINL